MKNTLLFLLLLFISSHPAAAQTPDARIKGRVADADTKSAIDYADVLLFKKNKPDVLQRVELNEKGEFTFRNVKAGDYTVMVKLIGYDLLTAEVVLAHPEPTADMGLLFLKPLETGLAEVEVVANKRQIVYKLDKKVVDASANRLGSGGTAVDILENTPSVRVDAEGEVTFRGSSGFTVYVDGKPSVFTGTQALEQIPAGQIENIELITTPSARHDTEGAVGIINIITKKRGQQGLSGIVNLTGSTHLTRGADFLLTQQQAASRWYVGGAAYDRLRKSRFDQEKTTIVGDLNTVSHSKGPRQGDRYNYTLKGGWSYSLPQTTFTIDAEAGHSGNKRNGELRYGETQTGTGAIGSGQFVSKDDYDNKENIGLGSLSVAHKFNRQGHELTASYYYKYGGNAVEYFQSDLYNEQMERQQGHRAWEPEHRITTRGNLDYTLPFCQSWKLDAGYQYFSYLEDSQYKMQFWNPQTGQFYWRDDIYNTSYFRHNIHSLYGILHKTIRRFEAQAGLRAEQTHRVLRSSVAGASRVFDRFDLFPSLHLGYTLPHDQQLLAAYSRRTTRPELYFMEPYITYRDFYTAEIGNPDIRPEYIDSYEVNYKKNFGENSVSATAFHRSRRDKIERLRVPYTAGVTLDSMANVGHDYSTGVELSGTLRATHWWNTSVNGNLYHYRVENQRQAGGKTESSTNYDIRWNNVFDAGRYTRIQLDGNFVGPSVTTQGKTNSFWYVNLSLRQQMWQRKLTATLAFRDVFGSARYVSRINTADLISTTRIRPKYPNITLSISYAFNSYKAKTAQARENHDLFEGVNH